MPAGSLRTGDAVKLQSGEYVSIEEYQVVILDEPIPVYNFHVEDFECYYVSEQSVLVHNNTCTPQSTKSVNLPSYKKINVDMQHILSGHIKGGTRIGKDSSKTLFPEGYSPSKIRKAIVNAYKNGKKIKTQNQTVLVRGKSGNLNIEMWVNKSTKTIESAYPVIL